MPIVDVRKKQPPAVPRGRGASTLADSACPGGGALVTDLGRC
ncbi:hypothetical protein RCG67_05775 [Kocuria sp. CPCC 205292]